METAQNAPGHLQAYIAHLSSTDGLFEMLLILMILVWVAGRITQKFGLPEVLGEIVAGILLGPIFLGIEADSEVLFLLAELGVFFLMFHAGLDTDASELAKHARPAVALWFGSLFPTFAIGYLVVRSFDYSLSISLFFAAVISTNSIPVITAILRKAKLKHSKIGHAAHGASVGLEISLFVLVSILLSIQANGFVDTPDMLLVILKVFAFLLGTVILGQLVLPYFSRFLNTFGSKGFTFALIVALLFGIFAKLIGLHIILGAFLGGLFVRREMYNKELFAKIEDRYFGLAYSFLGPIFFAYVGMNISFEFFSTIPIIFLVLLLVIPTAQIAGSTLCVYLFGNFSKQDALVSGIVMIGRGGAGIIFAGVGFSGGLIPGDLFSVIVGIAFFTTIIAPFLIKMVKPRDLTLFSWRQLTEIRKK